MFFLSLLLLPLLSAEASSLLDQRNSYKNVAAAVANTAREPVLGDQVEAEILNVLQREGRFEFSEKGYEILKKGLIPLALPILDGSNETKFKPLTPTYDLLTKIGVPAIFLADITRGQSKSQVHVHLITTTDGKKIMSGTADVSDPKALESYSVAASEALVKAMRGIPFEGSVIKRDGYRIILDRGNEIFRVGMQLPVYTIEDRDGQMLFEETGLIQITQVDRTLSFAKVMAENKPREIVEGNKVRMSDVTLPMLAPLVMNSGEDRSPAAVQGEVFEVNKGKLGLLNASLGPNIFKLSSTTVARANGPKVETVDNLISPSGSLRAELWLTSRWFSEMALGYGFAQYSEPAIPGSERQSVSTGVSEFRLLGGYRLNIFAPDPGPVVRVKLGFGSDSFSFGDVKGRTPSHYPASYKGLMIGGGIQFQVYEKFSGAFDVDTLIFPSVLSAAPGTEGVGVSGVSAWDMAFRCLYDYARDLDFEGKLLFRRNGADFASDTGLVSTTQFSMGLIAGVNYYF